MDNELIKLKEELKKVKEKYKKKCAILKKSNETINRLKPRYERKTTWEHAQETYFCMLREMTCHLDKHVYEVSFTYDSITYTEPQIESFGSRWIIKSLIYFLAKEKEIIVRSYEIKILNVKKLW